MCDSTKDQTCEKKHHIYVKKDAREEVLVKDKRFFTLFC